MNKRTAVMHGGYIDLNTTFEPGYDFISKTTGMNSFAYKYDSILNAKLNEMYTTNPEFFSTLDIKKRIGLKSIGRDNFITRYYEELSEFITMDDLYSFVTYTFVLIETVKDSETIHTYRVPLYFNSSEFKKLVKVGITAVMSLTSSSFSNRIEGGILRICNTGYIDPATDAPVYTKKKCFTLTEEILKKYGYDTIKL